MGGLKKSNSNRRFLTVKADGKFHQKSREGAPDAELYEWKNEKTGESGNSWDIVYNEVEGRITDLYFYENEYGKTLNVVVSWEGDAATIQLKIDQNYAEDLMKKLPGVNFEEEVRLRPYNFEGDDGKKIRGITVSQLDGREWEKLPNYFFEKETKETKHGFPEPEGNTKKYDRDDWKAHFIRARKFLINYVEEHIVPEIKKYAGEPVTAGAGPRSDDSYSDDEGQGTPGPIPDSDIPF
jgi:hypothetical protein